MSRREEDRPAWNDEYALYASGQRDSDIFIALWEPTNKAYEFTHEEMQRMSRYNSLDYAEPASIAYREHLLDHQTGRVAIRWIVFALIGFVIGLWGFAMMTTIETITQWKRSMYEQFINRRSEFVGYSMLMSFLMTVISALLCVVVPAAAGSGVAEVMAYLNGVMFPKVFNFRTLLAKSVSTVLSVCGGLPVGAEGPMIHIGSLLAAGISSGRSRTLKCSSAILYQYRNTKDARDFVTAGAAAGITFVFRAPIGGLLFVMEEVASFLPVQLAWRVLFSCLCAHLTGAVLDTYFNTWSTMNPQGTMQSGDIAYSALTLFGVVTGVPVNVFSIIVAAVIGVCGGLLATGFTVINMNVIKWRNKFIARSAWRRVAEPVMIALIFSTMSFILATYWKCEEMPSYRHTKQKASVPYSLFTMGCNATNTHNSFASLALLGPQETIRALFNSPDDTYDPFALLTWLGMYFFFGAISSGTSVSHGVLIPSVMIGAVMGRLTGQTMSNLVYLIAPSQLWSSSGLFAVVGSAAFFAGLSRLTFSLTIIALEMTNDLTHLLVILVAVYTGKFVADAFTTSLYHGVLRSKCVPFLDNHIDVHKVDLHCVRDIMTSPVLALHSVERIGEVAAMLINTSHHGFPIVTQHGKLKGLVTRDALEELLWFVVLTSNRSDDGAVINSHGPPSYDDLKEIREKIFWNRSPSATRHPLLQPLMSMWLDLTPYVDTSVVAVQETMSISRTHEMFRSLNLRHLIVIDMSNEPVGIITRKDLVTGNIETKLRQAQAFVARRRTDSHLAPIVRERPNLSPSGLQRRQSQVFTKAFYSSTLVLGTSPRNNTTLPTHSPLSDRERNSASYPPNA